MTETPRHNSGENHNKPEQLAYPYLGIQSINLSTSRNIYNPVQTAIVAHEANARLGITDDKDKRIRVDLFAPQGGVVNNAIRATGMKWPIGVSEKDFPEWKKVAPSVEIDNVYSKFAYDPKSLLFQPIADLGNGLWYQLYAVASIAAFGPETSGHSPRLVRALKDLQEHQPTLTMDSNVFMGYKEHGLLPGLVAEVGPVNLHNQRARRSSLKDPRLMSHPDIINEQLVEAHPEIGGFVYGMDHSHQEGIDYIALLKNPLIRRNTVAINIGGTFDVESGRNAHVALDLKHPKVEDLINAISNTSFAHPIRLVLNYKPDNLSKDEQVDNVVETYKYVMEQQGRDKRLDPPAALQTTARFPRPVSRGSSGWVSAVAGS